MAIPAPNAAASAKLKRIKSRVKKNPAIAQIAAARAAGKAGAPGQLKKAAGVQSARQFTPAGPHRNLPAVPKPATPVFNPRMAPRLPSPGLPPAKGQNPLAGNPAAAAARKYGFDLNKVQEAAKRKSTTNRDIKKR